MKHFSSLSFIWETPIPAMYPGAVVLLEISPWWDGETLPGLEGWCALELTHNTKWAWCFLGCVTAVGVLLQAEEKEL